MQSEVIRHRRGRSIRGLVLALTALSALACQTYRPAVALGHYEEGDFEAAQEEIADPPWWRGHRDHDQLIWLLEEAKILRDLGRYEESSETFEAALALFEKFVLLEPEWSVSNELASLTSQVLRKYRGSFADAILASTLQALNDLAVGNASNARSAALKAYNWQTEAKIYFEKELARAGELAKEKELDRDALLDTPEMKAETDRVGAYVQPGYADYLNPLASFVSGIAHCANGGFADAKQAFVEVLGMVPENSYVKRLVEDTQKPADRTVYLLYERGMAPAREEFRLAFPTPNGPFTVAVPVFRPQADPASHLLVTGADLELRTEPLTSIDSIIAAQFRHDLPGIIVRTVVSTILKEVGQHTANKFGGWIEVLYTFFKFASSGADLRTWRTIGCEYQVAVFTLPADGAFEVRLVDKAGRPGASETVILSPAPVSVVAVRSIGLGVLKVRPPKAASIEG